MNLTPLQLEQLVEAYLAGRLTDADRGRFERIMADRADVREAVATQRRVDASLGRLFGDGGAAVSLPSPIAKGSRSGWRRLAYGMAAAAVLVLAGVGVWAGWAGWAGRVPSGPSPLQMAYQAQIDAGFIPQTVCTGPVEFATWMRDYFSQPLYPSLLDSGVELVGWNYAQVLSSRSGVLLARVDRKPVIVVVDYASREKKELAAPTDPELHRFRAKLGSVVLYEVSPFDHPSILPHLSTTLPPGVKLPKPGES